MSANPQVGLDFGRMWRVDEEFRSSMRALQDVYAATGNIVAAGATGIDKGDLPKMFEPGSGRHLRFKAVFQLCALDSTSIEQRKAVIEPLARCVGLGICQPEPMTDKEARIRLESALRALGPIGEQAMFAALGGRK